MLGRVKRELRTSPIVLLGGEESRLSFSVGVARWRESDDAQGLLRRVDEALYRAKAGSRSSVVLAE